MKYFCCNKHRRDETRSSKLNGIDFLEVLDRDASSDKDRQRFLFVHFLKDLGTPLLDKTNIVIEGGERIRDIKVVKVQAGKGKEANVLTVEVEKPGDFSTYSLRLVSNPTSSEPPDGIDPRLAAIDFSFKVECPTDFDCAPERVCPPQPKQEPDIDYLAKDYASFRRLMLDRMAVLMPEWKERNPADFGIAMVEALAYTADQLSYQQDAVATEAYIGTARRRVSVRRHARLMDYFMSEGCNARTWVHIEVTADIKKKIDPKNKKPIAVLPKNTRLFTRISGQKTTIADDPKIYRQAQVAFETMEPVYELYKAHNELHFYTWSDERCCLLKGATQATLLGHFSNLKPGNVLILEEVLGAESGDEDDADPMRRHAVRLTSVKYNAIKPGSDKIESLKDPVTGKKITEISWHEEDVLPFAFCISANTKNGYMAGISVARGNIVLADHGFSVQEESLEPVPKHALYLVSDTQEDHCKQPEHKRIYPRFQPRLERSPLTHSAPAPDKNQSAVKAMQWELRHEEPSIHLKMGSESSSVVWKPRRDLLNSASNAEEFVVEIENDGVARLRFGDGKHGKRPEHGTIFAASYRVGNGVSGNIGADSLEHIVSNLNEIKRMRNPLPAKGGREPESMEDVRQCAPIAYRTQERAVTPQDYAEMTERFQGVQQAATTFRWTGSWHTAFVTVDREEGRQVTPAFENDVRKHLEPFRMAGHDLEVDGPRNVALEIELEVCVGADYFRSDIKRELLDVLSNRDLPDGRRGLFHPDNFTFGQPVYSSPIYAVVQSIPGVDSVNITTFRRIGSLDIRSRETGKLEIGRLEIARLDNDPNFQEHGVLRIELGGGK